MKYQRHLQDINKRQKYKKTELDQRLNKVLLFTFTTNVLKWIVAKNNFEKFKSDSLHVKIKRFCIISGRSKGVFKKFKVSRIILRELSGRGFFFGLKKAS